MSAKDVICGTFSLKIDFYFEIGAICVSVATQQLKIWLKNLLKFVKTAQYLNKICYNIVCAQIGLRYA